jgi:SulP family sulfate permease
MLRINQFRRLIRTEFHQYSLTGLRRDIIAGLTVAAVCLPLALAYGIAGGMTPAAGLVTAIMAGLITGLLGGTAYQISGPTGAMSAVLLVVLHRTGLMGMWTATLVGGALLVLMGILRFGRYVVFIPTPVITGFTCGIAVIIGIGQIDAALGISTPPADTGLLKLLGYFAHHPTIS